MVPARPPPAPTEGPEAGPGVHSPPMRGPIAVGVMAALLVVLLAGAGFVALALGRPGPAIPTPPPVAAAPTPAGPDTTPAPTATSGPAGSPSSTAAASPTPAASGPTTEPSPSSRPSEGPEVGLSVGDVAPRLTVPQLGGGGAEIDTAALAGKPVWVNFMATWCPPCVDELPVMERLQGQLGERMTIIVIDVREDQDRVASFMTALAVDLPVGLDMDGAAQQAWGAYALPVHYWIGPDGRVGGFLYGGAGPQQFIDGVHTVLPDASLAP